MTPPSESAVRRGVIELRPEATVIDINPIEAGKNAVYAVSFADRETVLKVGIASPARVRAEPSIVEFVRERTTVPVPAVLGAADDVFDHPCCLFERVPGQTVPDRSDDLAVGVLLRLCEEGGQHLAALHKIDAFDAVGPLVSGDDGVVVTESSEDWPSLLGRSMRAKIDELGEQFDPYTDRLREYVESAVGEYQHGMAFDPVFVHMDYRPANL